MDQILAVSSQGRKKKTVVNVVPIIWALDVPQNRVSEDYFCGSSASCWGIVESTWIVSN